MATEDINLLRKEFGRNKIIPAAYEKAILIALSHYPELKNVKIRFRLKKQYPVPYATRPGLGSFLKSPGNREYIVTLRESAKPPITHALFRNLPFAAKIAVIGHELGHVLQYHSMNYVALIKTALAYVTPAFQKKMKRGADRHVVLHGLGRELYSHALYMRNIPGYIRKRKEINRNYLRPKEIRSMLN